MFEAAELAIAVWYYMNTYRFSILKEDGQKTTELGKHCKDFGMNIHLVAVFFKKNLKKETT